MARLPGHIVACSNSEAELARKRLGTSKVMTVENAVDLKMIVPKFKGRSSRLRVVSSGRLCYQKAPWRFASLARQLSRCDVTFTWIGGGENCYVQALSETGKVDLTGWLDPDTALRAIADADIYVLLSLWEGMPLTLIEAQASGLPAVVTDVVGSRDIIEDGVTGFVCRTDEEITARVQLLIDDQSLRIRMGNAAKERAITRFDTQRMYKDMLAVYRKCSPTAYEFAPKKAEQP